jgi:hypothetical protein
VSDLDVVTRTAGAAGRSALDEAERYQRFDRLQRNMGRVWDAMGLNLENESVVVIPSGTLDRPRRPAFVGPTSRAWTRRVLCPDDGAPSLGLGATRLPDGLNPSLVRRKPVCHDRAGASSPEDRPNVHRRLER